MILGLADDLTKYETLFICCDMAEISLPNTVLEHLNNTKYHTLFLEHFIYINLFNTQNDSELDSATICFGFYK